MARTKATAVRSLGPRVRRARPRAPGGAERGRGLGIDVPSPGELNRVSHADRVTFHVASLPGCNFGSQRFCVVPRHLREFVPRPPPVLGRPHRFRPASSAIREIRRFQRSVGKWSTSQSQMSPLELWTFTAALLGPLCLPLGTTVRPGYIGVADQETAFSTTTGRPVRPGSPNIRCA